MADPFLGQISMFAGNFAPASWAYCNGQLLQISQFSALFSLLGTTYGGDGQVTFALPDLRGRVPVHSGDSQGPGVSNRPLGSRSGAESTVLAVNNLPAHSHDLACSDDEAESDEPNGKVLAKTGGGESIYRDSPTTGSTMNGGAVSSTGNNAPFSNMPPFLAINFIIALQGVFPSES